MLIINSRIYSLKGSFIIIVVGSANKFYNRYVIDHLYHFLLV